MFNIDFAAVRQRALGRIIRGFNPNIQRMMMLSSLIAGLSNNEPEQQFVRNLDSALKLSRSSEDSLKFPARLTKVLWGNMSVYQREVDILRDVRAPAHLRRTAAREILAATPEYFRYAPLNEIIDDLVRYYDYAASHQAA